MRLNKNYYQVKEHWNQFGQSENWNDYIAKRNKNPTDPFYIIEMLKDVKGKTIVEFGCNDGSLTEHLIKAGAFVRGVDFAQSLLDKANKRLYGQAGFSLSPIIRDFSIITDLSADIVLAVSILEHLPEDMMERIIQDARRVLKKDGLLILRVPFDKKHEVYLNDTVPALDTVHWTTTEIEELAKKHRYEIIKVGFFTILKKASEL